MPKLAKLLAAYNSKMSAAKKKTNVALAKRKSRAAKKKAVSKKSKGKIGLKAMGIN
jgi:hypothetical protein